MFKYWFTIKLNSFSEKSGHKVSVKNNSVYVKLYIIKLLNRLYPPVLISMSGSGNPPKKNKLSISFWLSSLILFSFVVIFVIMFLISSLKP